ncbi:hypothetical protein [Ideonella azotifigens]|uniref:Uncharacterized protein n=1 Tax=Ideonella azotifigens TaxID=513160 RepID=A0ABN1JYW0_9BURK|nr:hypothetical protein [Ideonella azotifigens]
MHRVAGEDGANPAAMAGGRSGASYCILSAVAHHCSGCCSLEMGYGCEIVRDLAGGGDFCRSVPNSGLV